MIYSIIVVQKEVDIEIEKESTLPIKAWLSDITISFSRLEALELGTRLVQAVQDLDYQLRGDV